MLDRQLSAEEFSVYLKQILSTCNTEMEKAMIERNGIELLVKKEWYRRHCRN